MVVAVNTVQHVSVGTKLYQAGWEADTTHAMAPGAAIPVVVRKTADETVNNSVALQNDDALKLTMAANEVWHVKVFILATSPTVTTDIILDFAIPAGCTAHAWYWKQDASAALSYAHSSDITTDLVCNTPVSAQPIFLAELVVINAANAGDLQFRWAQNNAVAEDTKVLTNSFMICTKLA